MNHRDNVVMKIAEALWTADGYDLNADPDSRTAQEYRPGFIAQAEAMVDLIWPLLDTDSRRIKRSDTNEAVAHFDSYWASVEPKIRKAVRHAFVAGFLRKSRLDGSFLPEVTRG